MSKKKQSVFRGKVSRNIQDREQAASSFGYLKIPSGVEIFKEEAGDKPVLLDIIPYLVTDEHHMDRNDDEGIAQPGNLWYTKPFLIHRNIGPDNETVVCLKTVGKPCPICEYRSKLFKEEAPKEETDALKLSRRHLYFVIPIGHKKLDEEIHLWDISFHNFQKLLDKELKMDEEYEVFPDFEEGYTLKVRFDEVQLGQNKFAEASRIDFKKRDEAYDEEAMLESLPNLDEVLKIRSYEELKKLFFELEEEDDVEEETREIEEDEEEEKPKKGIARKKKSITKKRDEEPEEDEEEEPEEEDEPEEEEKPKPKRNMTRRSDKKESKKKKDEDDGEPEEECPNGLTFGVDTDTDNVCDTCALWDACTEAKERNEK